MPSPATVTTNAAVTLTTRAVPTNTMRLLSATMSWVRTNTLEAMVDANVVASSWRRPLRSSDCSAHDAPR